MANNQGGISAGNGNNGAGIVAVGSIQTPTTLNPPQGGSGLVGRNLSGIGLAACGSSGAPAVLANGNIILVDGNMHRHISNFDEYERVGMNDAILVNGLYINLWDQLYQFSTSHQEGRFLIVDKKYIQFIEMYSTHFGDYAGLTLKEFLVQMTNEDK